MSRLGGVLHASFEAMVGDDSKFEPEITLGRLPADHGFVVQFQNDSADSAEARGRIEHVISGRSRRFVGWTGDQGLVSELKVLLHQVRSSPSDRHLD